MSSYVRNATPRAILHGIEDRSIRQPVAVPELIPQHLPHVFLFTERGSLEPQLMVGDSLVKTYGQASFLFTERFANHQTAIAQTVNAAANTMLVQRLKPEGATTATLRLSLEVQSGVPVPQYERQADGQWLRDVSGNLVQVLDEDDQPVFIPGVIYIWHLNYAGHTGAFGEANTAANVYPRGTGTASSVYPIFDFEVGSHGAYGNRVGLRLSAPNGLSSSPSDITMARSLKEFIYRFQFVERPENMASPNIVKSILGASALDLVLTPNVLHPKFNTKISVGDSLIQSYEDKEPAIGPKVVGPFGRLHVYHANIDVVRNTIFASEGTALNGSTDLWVPVDYADNTNVNLTNIINNLDFNGVPYETVRRGTVVDTTMVTFDAGQVNTLYAVGGNDGDLSDASFDLLVRNQVSNYGDFEYPLLDMARYPQSVIYDSGFTLETKLAIPTVIGRRKDMWVALATHAVGRWVDDPDNPGEQFYEAINTPLTVAEEQSMGIALRTAVDLFPESEIYGTSVCRAIIVNHSGTMLNSQYNGLLPLTVDIASKMAKYQGAGIGRWQNGQAPDIEPNNQVTTFKNLNNTWKPDNVYNTDWENGLIWAQSYDTRSFFYPAYQTAYPNDTSVLNSLMVMTACVELEKVAHRTWRSFTGRTDLTAEQLIEKSDRKITEMTEGRFDGRFVIRPETFITGEDEQRGFSWSCNIHIYANNMTTVGVFTIVAHRMSELEG